MSPGSTDSVSTSLLMRARANDRTAWERLAGLFTPIVYGWVRRGGVPEADAADVVQDVFFEVARGLARFHRDQPGDSFGGWLRVLTRRRTCDYFRRGDPPAAGGSTARVLMEQVPEPAADADPTDDPTAEVLHRGLELIRDQFEPRTWQAFQAVAVNERPAADVAVELGLSVGAVYVAKSRVLKRLREELDGLI
jgi:RNA polymerase sigma-70 factor, ECF subfamily